MTLMENAGDRALSQADALIDAGDDLMSNRFVLDDHHFTLAVYAESVKSLRDHMSVARAALADTGMVAAREGAALEAAYWSQLVGNFAWRARPAPITSLNFAAFSPFHTLLMSARPDKQPGRFKSEANRAGSTLFVAPDQVEGTLARGFEYYDSLDTPFARAVFMMFLVSEVHPFVDGNGRIARIMMNAELVAAGEERIIIPTVYRSNYLSALKAMSQSSQPTPIIRTLDFARKWVAAVSWTDLESTRRVLESCHAFVDPTEADDRGIRLRLPAQAPE